MLEALKFVQGAVAKKDFLPAMTHFVIEKGFVRSFNGTLALSAPIPLDIDCKPKADQFIKAISSCNDVVNLSLTPAKRLKVTSGAFKAFIECVDETTLHVEPEGELFNFNGEAFMNALKVISPIVGDDAVRTWSNGVLFKGQSAFATNNIVLAEYWTGVDFPVVVNVPRIAIKEILRIGTPPVCGQITENSITFHFADGRWVRSQLLETKWPDLSRIFDAKPNAPYVPFPAQLFTAIDYLRPFGDKLGRIYFSEGVVSTTNVPEEGAFFDIENFSYQGIYSMDMLDMLRDVAEQIDFTAYPAPCLFYGDCVRGAIVGMRI